MIAAIKDHATGNWVPIYDTSAFEFVCSFGMNSAIFSRFGDEFRFLIGDCRRAGMWKQEYDDLPNIDQSQEEDARCITHNGDLTR